MKNYKYYLVLVLSVFALSCEDSLTDLENIGNQTAEVYYNDPTNAMAGLNSAYSSMSRDEFFVYGDILSDDALKGGSDFFDWVDREYLRQFTANSGNGVSNGTWSLLYTGIVRSNEIINKLPGATFEETLKNRIIGEAKFLRAYAYSKLVVLYGGIPLITKDYNVDELSEPRSSISDVYALIKEDLDYAIQVLPVKSAYDVADLGRATKGAAQALKARVLMQETSYEYNSTLASFHSPDVEANWSEVYDLTLSIVNSGEYDLETNFASIFESEYENGVESIFEVQHKTTNNDWGESVGNTTIVQMGNRDDWGWCFNLPTDALYNAFADGDPRREATIYGQEFDVLYGVKQAWDKQIWTLEHESTKDEVTSARLNRKYALRPELRHGNHNNQSTNKRIIRYADVLLMHAEAAYYKGDEGRARTITNLVRSRAQQSTLPYGSSEGQTSGYTFDIYPGATVPPITATGQDLIQAIWHERRVELALEGLRYFDIVRTGRTELLPFEDNYKSHDGLLPIPIGDVNSFGLSQNKGY